MSGWEMRVERILDMAWGEGLIVQNVFNMTTGGMKGTMSELERRKFTAEEGVSPMIVYHDTRRVKLVYMRQSRLRIK